MKKKKKSALPAYFTNLPKLIGQFYLVLNQIHVSRSLFLDLLCLFTVCVLLQHTVSVFQGKMKDG